MTDASLRQNSAGKNHIADTETRIAMYRDMVRTRLVEEEIVKRYSEQEMRCPTHICIGQEAPPAGVSAHLRRSDSVFSAHRSHGHYLSKGGDLNAMIAEIYGRMAGCADGKGGSQHLVDLEAGFMGSAPILASTISVGVGYAWAQKRRGKDTVTVIYFGDGATEEGAFHEAMNFAGVNKLPVVFVCENNLYSVHTTLDIRQPDRGIHELSKAHGTAGASGDGNDADEVWRLAGEAVERARTGGGPTILEFHTYRLKEHVGPNTDDHLGYRSKAEVDDWAARCPIVRYEATLLGEGVLDAAQPGAIRSELIAEVGSAFDFARRAAFPEPGELARFVFPEPLDRKQAS